jgi:hypothetical protein
MIDVDEKDKAGVVDLVKAKASVSAIVSHLKQNGFHPHVEISKSKGYHVWVFFDEPILAKIIRPILEHITKAAGEDGREIFPKQIEVTDNGFGNFVALPLNGESVREQKTVFLEPDFTPIKDQWKYLEHVSLTKVENIGKLPQAIQEEPAPKVETMSSPSEPVFSVAKFLEDHRVGFTIKQDSDKTFYLLPECFWADQHTTPNGNGDSAVIQDTFGLITYHCFHDHCKNRTWRDVRKILQERPETQTHKDKIENDSKLKKNGYNLIQGKELLEMEEQETHWLWEGILIAGGLGWLVSKPKVGKSVTGLNLGVRVSRGEPFLGKNTTQGFVVYLALEDSQDEVRKNLIKMGGDFTNIYFHFGMAPKDALEQLIILMEERKPVLVIIDIAQKLLRAKKIEDYAEAISKLEPLNEAARKYNCQVLLTGHAPKIDRDLIDSILGSSGYSGSVDTVMGIKKDRNGRRSFSTIQRYHKSGQPDIEDWVLKLCSDEITIELAGLVHEVNIRDAKEQILGILSGIGADKFYSEPMTESQIREEIKRDKQFTLNCLKELYQEGRIVRKGEGKRNSPYRYSV